MDGYGAESVIDEEVRAFVLSLCSALGGSSAGDDGRYVLGDDALAVLKDIKRWLRLYDDKLQRLDIARLLATANLVKGDLLEILGSWPDDAVEGSFRSKVSLLCVDLLTQLTWPIHKDENLTTMQRYIHMPSLNKAQASYKAAVLYHDSNCMLRTVVRVALPALAQPPTERSPMEDNIIKVVLYFFRNMAMISQPEDDMAEEFNSDISRSTTIDAFHRQDIFNLILTIGSGMHEDFSTHDVAVLDILFHIVKGVDVDKLFMDKQERLSEQTAELQNLMSREKGMMAGYARHAPSRHNRFGAMMWVKRDDGKYSTVFGQKATANQAMTMAEIDKRKKWTRPQRKKKADTSEVSSAAFSKAVPLTASATRHLRSFVQQFLDSSFNPLFLAVRRSIDRVDNRVEKIHTRQYLYLISWFLRAECIRRRKQAAARAEQPSSAINEVESFSLVATVLNQETFVLLNRSMQRALDEKDWQDLVAGMRCFTQILLTVQEMSESPLDEDQEIAENILNRIFYEQTTHDRIVTLLRSHKDQDFNYLDACTELSHVFIRLLERYSKQNVDMQVRSRRRARKKKREAAAPNDESIDQEERAAAAEDIAEAQRTTSERKFDFNKYAAKFVNQSTVDTFFAFLRHYRDLTPEQLKRAHRFFYRVAFKMEQTTLLFRMDMIELFNKLIKGPENLDPDNPAFKEWEEFVRQVFRRLIKRMQDRPAMAIELLFSKINSTLYYLEHGYDLAIPKSRPRPPAELEVKPGMGPDERIGVAVSLLINQSKSDVLVWVKKVLSSAAVERKAWEDANVAIRTMEETTQTQEASETIDGDTQNEQQELESAEIPHDPVIPSPEDPKAPLIFVKPDDPSHREAMNRDKFVRLLLTVLNFQCLHSMAEEDDPVNAPWIIPSSIKSTELTRHHDLINKFEFDPPVYEDGKSADSFVRRKTEPRPAANPREQDLDSEGDSGSDIDRHLFPAGGPNIHRASVSPTRGPRRRRNKHQPDELLDGRGLEERREARRRLEAERARKIKSELFVRDSDDESDDERDRAFFAQEEQRRRNAQKAVAEAMGKAGEDAGKKKNKTQKTKVKKRKAGAVSDGDDSTDDEVSSLPSKRRRGNGAATSSSEIGSYTSADSPAMQAALDSTDDAAANDTSAETDTEETPPSSQRPSSGHGGYDIDDNDAATAATPSIHKASSPVVRDVRAVDGPDSGSDKENEGSASSTSRQYVRPALEKRRNVRAGFIIDSDSDN